MFLGTPLVITLLLQFERTGAEVGASAVLMMYFCLFKGIRLTGLNYSHADYSGTESATNSS